MRSFAGAQDRDPSGCSLRMTEKESPQDDGKGVRLRMTGRLDVFLFVFIFYFGG